MRKREREREAAASNSSSSWVRTARSQGFQLSLPCGWQLSIFMYTNKDMGTGVEEGDLPEPMQLYHEKEKDLNSHIVISMIGGGEKES